MPWRTASATLSASSPARRARRAHGVDQAQGVAELGSACVVRQRRPPCGGFRGRGEPLRYYRESRRRGGGRGYERPPGVPAGHPEPLRRRGRAPCGRRCRARSPSSGAVPVRAGKAKLSLRRHVYAKPCRRRRRPAHGSSRMRRRSAVDIVRRVAARGCRFLVHCAHSGHRSRPYRSGVPTPAAGRLAGDHRREHVEALQGRRRPQPVVKADEVPALGLLPRAHTRPAASCRASAARSGWTASRRSAVAPTSSPGCTTLAASNASASAASTSAACSGVKTPSRRRRCTALPHSTGLAHHTIMSGSSVTRASTAAERPSRTKRGRSADESQNLSGRPRARRGAPAAAGPADRRVWAGSRTPAARRRGSGAPGRCGPGRPVRRRPARTGTMRATGRPRSVTMTSSPALTPARNSLSDALRLAMLVTTM